ncbi:uncharacterized protein LOC110983696 isoform X2 [Acanthaster planci]|uniref:Uncharacterized protein LOC110983696 isoform X2 n=1 Tax=Acanthaster planci TaxID=133434 RepID=A0A8B7YZT0_ACAPL|nr:uncharacterized protein LOC110983696 isoform X2 [Acanthaster planci]
MFNNQLGTKDLYSTNPSQFLQRSGLRSDYEDSAFNSSLSQSNSQIMSSQVDNSQSSSFDMFSQMMSQQQGFSQQTENSNNPQRFYMKYMSKAPLFNKEPDKNSSSRKKSFQEQLDSNKQKAKESDERDLINTFINLVKECTEEVKSAATDIRKDVDKNLSESASQFGSLIQKINEDLKHYHNTLLGAVKAREDQKTTLDSMQRDLTAKDAKIEVLEAQLAAADQQRDDRVVSSLVEAYTEQQKKNREQMDKMQAEQEAFCKTQLASLQLDQQKYIQRLESERGAAKAREPQMAMARGDDHGSRQAGVSLIPSVTETGHRPRSWQGWPQYQQIGYNDQVMRSYHENPGYQVIPLHSQPNNVSIGPVVIPTSVSSSNHGNCISLTPTSVALSVPHLQNRETYLPTTNQCYQGHNTHDQSSVNQQIGPDIPYLQTGSSSSQENRQSGPILQWGNQAALPLLSPTDASNQHGPWNKLKPSPVAAIAPQVKPREIVPPSQQQCSDESTEEAIINETPQAVATKRKKGQKRYQVAVKTRKQSSRLKSKQGSKPCNRRTSMGLDQENQVMREQHGKQRGVTVPSVDTVQPLQIKKLHHLLEREEDVYEFKEQRGKTVSNAKHKPQGNQDKRIQQIWPSRDRAGKDVQSNKNPSTVQRHLKEQSQKVLHPVPKHPMHSQAVDPLPRTTKRDVCSHTDSDKEAVSAISNKTKAKGKEKSCVKRNMSSEDGIFSQSRISTCTKSRDLRGDGARSSVDDPKVQRENVKISDVTVDGNSSDQEEDESQSPDEDASQELSSEYETKEDSEEQARELIKIQRKNKQPAKRKQLGMLASSPEQHYVSQLDTMPSYSDQEDSSEEMIFSLKLPDSPFLRKAGHNQTENPREREEQVVPMVRRFDILSTPYIQVNRERDTDNESTGTAYSVNAGRKLSRHAERKRRLSHYSGSSSSAAMLEITNCLRLQHHKIRRVSSCC